MLESRIAHMSCFETVMASISADVGYIVGRLTHIKIITKASFWVVVV